MMKLGTFEGPMLLSEISKPFDDEDYIFELKFDGYRAIIHSGNNIFKIYSRNGRDLLKIYPELKNVKKILKKDVIIDGEIVTFENGHPSFSKLQNRSHLKSADEIKRASLESPVCFIAFDCLFSNGDLTDKPLMERKKELEKIPDSDEFIKSTYISRNGKKLFQKVKKLDLEGIIAKKKESKYSPNYRSKEWIKIKNLKKGSFLVLGFIQNKVNASLLLGDPKKKDPIPIGKVSIPLGHPFFKIVRSLPKDPNKNIEKNITWVASLLKCRIEYLERTPNGSLRQPVFIGPE